MGSFTSPPRISRQRGVYKLLLEGTISRRGNLLLETSRRYAPNRAMRHNGTPLDLELAKDIPIVPFHRTQGEEQPLANLLIRESLSHEVEDFQLTWAEWLDQGLGRWGQRRCVFALLRLCFHYHQQFPCIVRHHPLSRGCGQEVSHRGTFVDKETDEAARRGERQRVTEHLHRLVLFAMR